MNRSRGWMWMCGVTASCGVASAALLTACRAGAPPAAEALGIEAVLARARAAVDGDWSGRGWVATGRSEYLGEAGEFSMIFEGSGAFASQSTGPLGQSTGFDGQTAWEHDFAGSSRVLEAGDRANSLVEAWLITGEWMDRARELDLRLEESADEGVTRLSFSLGGWADRGTIVLDADTGLPASATWTGGSETVEVTFDGWRDLGGLTMPSHVHQRAGELVSQTWIESLEEAPVFIRSPYQMVRGGSDATFDPGTSPSLEVKRAPSGHLLVKGLFNGQDVGWFIFDTGAGANIINNRVAGELGLVGFGEVNASGVGGSVKTQFFKAESLTVGPATLHDAVLVGLDLSFLEPIFGVKLAGLVGYNVLSRVVAEVDMAEGTISLHNPAAYAREGVEWEHVALISRHPCVKGTFEGHEAMFRIDTGAGNDNVIFHGAAVENLNLLEGRETTISMLGGVGGAIPARRGVLKDFTVAGRTHTNVEATFALPKDGAMNDPWLGGTLGGGFLKPFVMVLNYPEGKIGFVER